MVQDILKKQIEKWGQIQSAREKEQKLKQNITELEAKLQEATRNEDYDLAAELQGEIDKLTTKMINHENQRFKLEEHTKTVRAEFIEEIKDDNHELIEIESKLSTEKNIFDKTESEKISDEKATLLSKKARIEENEKGLVVNIQTNQEKLDEVLNKCDEKAKEHIAKKNKLDEAIYKVDEQITELER